MHRLLWVGSEIHTRESRSLVAATTARLPIDTLRAQSPPNTGSTIQYFTGTRYARFAVDRSVKEKPEGNSVGLGQPQQKAQLRAS